MAWYYGWDSAEGFDHFVVELTDQEYKAVQKFLDTDNRNYIPSYCEGYSGSTTLGEIRFDTKEDAINGLMDFLGD